MLPPIPPVTHTVGLDTLTWFEDVLSTAAKGSSGDISVKISYYIPGTPATPTDEESSGSEKSGLEQAVTKDYGRPVLRGIINGFCDEAGSVGIAGKYRPHMPFVTC